MIQIRLSDTRFILPLRVTPKSGKSCLLPFAEGDTVIRLKVAPPPENGKANEAVVQLFSDVLDLPKIRFQIVRGEKSREKQLAISVSSQAEAEMLGAKLIETLGSRNDIIFV